MADRIVIIGGGTGGTLVANRLARRHGAQAQITVVDRDDAHIYQPGLLFVPFGLADAETLVRPRAAQLHRGVELVLGEVHRVDLEQQAVHLEDGTELPYDVLVIASGATLLPGETDGLQYGDGEQEVHGFYTAETATRLASALEDFDGGRLLVNVVDMPVKCPVAPLEFCFLADWHLRRRGIRDRTELTFATPLDAAFTKPVAAQQLGGLLEQKGVALETEFATGAVAPGKLVSFDERELPFDLLVAVPVHGGAEYVGRSEGLGDATNFVLADPHTLQSRAAPNVFAIGDAANLPTSKAGSVTHFEGATVTENIGHLLGGEELEGEYDGHAKCFIETGFHRALLIDFNYEQEPLPGRMGPLPLMRESRLNHMAKLAFQSLYWHVLLPGHDVPGVSDQMRETGAGR
jgi:sulfide:quinone oxidoreductase